MLYSETDTGTIFAKKYMQGYVYLFRCKSRRNKRHSSMGNSILKLDDMLMKQKGSKSTFFVTIDHDQRGEGKVRSFSGKDRLHDEYFRMIFNTMAPRKGGNYDLQPEVIELQQNSPEHEDTYDVVKKRKAMDASPIEGDDSHEALTAFEDFESSVLPALEQIKVIDENSRKQEMLELEDSIAKGIFIQPTGGVYFAWSDCLNCTKIGATRRDTPLPRLSELSHGVTSPFKLTAWIPTPTPFRLESQTHARFTAKRIRNTGAGTEFFNLSEVETAAYIEQNWTMHSKFPWEV